MNKLLTMFRQGSSCLGDTDRTVVCVQRVKQPEPEQWDEAMPLPGDIIEGLAEEDYDDVESDQFVPVSGRAELSWKLKKLGERSSENKVWVKVRRGEATVKLRARVVSEKSGLLQRKYSIGAVTDERHVAVLGDLVLEDCSQLQEMSRRVVNLDGVAFNKRGLKYDWRMKAATYLPDPRSPIISSILFTPLTNHEQSVEATTSRSMAWFSAAVTSGVPLVFVNIQTETIIPKGSKEVIMNLKGIRVWFMPGVSEVPIEVVSRVGETRFGMDIKQTEEGFMCIYSVALGSAADRAGLRHLHEDANEMGYLLVISALDGKSVMPSNVCSSGLIQCCDHSELAQVMAAAIDAMDRIHLRIMAWPNRTRLASPQRMGAATLRPPPM